MNRVLLINPPYYIPDGTDFFPSFPLGIGYIASYLQSLGYSVKILDAFAEGYENQANYHRFHRIGLSDKEILSEIHNFSPDIIGISNMFSLLHYSLHSTAKIIKEYNKDLPVVAGGPHISAAPELVMRDKNIDFGILGEGEYTFSKLIKALRYGEDYRDISGLSYRDNGALKINRPLGFIENLDALPFPAWHLFKMDKYLYQKASHGGAVKKRPFMTILTSRGCPLNCFFCSVRDTWGRRFRMRSAGNVIQEIALLKEKFGIKEVVIVDDNFNFNIERMNIILDYFIKEKRRLILDVPNGLFIPNLNKDILLKMKSAGFWRIFFPIESGDEFILHKIIRKPVDLGMVKQLVNYCRKIHLDVVGYFILGLPMETKETMRRTFKLVRELKIKPYFSIATPFPGSDLYRFAESKGLLNSYKIEEYSAEYNINTSEWNNKDLKEFILYEKFKLNPLRTLWFNFKSTLPLIVKNPKKIVYYLRRTFHLVLQK
ncbi:MAG: B12-binding domain-containing radical SAM protein [Candidatus Omnitrophica bacterium]|nr:B12-binding domain-containing radical SAM protein [Candidatus Omnitrophota bacterium]